MSNITIKKIAELAGVSSATVSRILNNTGRYSEETKERVLEIIRDYNYRTNVVAKSLRTNKSKTIGVIVPDITNEFFANIVLAIENYSVPNGYSIFICNTSEDHEKEKMFVRDLEAKGVDGIIYLSGNKQIPEQTTSKHLPTVCIDRNPGNKEIVVVESDNFSGGFIATEELIQQGCKRIVIIKDERDVSPMAERYRGYREALQKHGIPLDENLVVNVKVDVHEATKAVQHLISRGTAFDAIFACTDWLAIGAINALHQHQILIPDEVKIIGFDNISVAQHSYPPLTTVEQDKTKLGEIAAQILLDMIDQKKPQKQNIVLPVSLVKRNTTL
ncbi:LacI family transcriptional regulator [Brevibacillus sp. SYP-B805]|uniref:LacI family DNA-binding transcriptional regulator n=1 Tax=Brevibacillus sp. SYP-B805 TaxID=1578199 RepID=UPI0013EB2086|nr:LacI family DNA-binding transcriptional regulator [Brevibacillus sp. SYP-B805]NGQ96698.1 LacI family transcriptional regulator [Brevibacillus sp. SYP-B805]